MKSLYILCPQWCVKTLGILATLMMCAQPAYSGYTVLIAKGGSQVVVSLPDNHFFTDEILGMIKAKGLVLSREKPDGTESAPDGYQQFSAVHSLVKKLSLPYAVDEKFTDLQRKAEEDGRYYYRPPSLLPNGHFTISVPELKAGQIWQDLKIANEQSLPGQLQWLFVMPETQSDNKMEVPESPSCTIFDLQSEANAVHVNILQDDDIAKIKEQGSESSEGGESPAESIVPNNLYLLRDFYHSLRDFRDHDRGAESGPLNLGADDVAARQQRIAEYAKASLELGSYYHLRWWFHSGLGWNVIEQYFYGDLQKSKGEREKGLDVLLNLLADLPKPLVKGALIKAGALGAARTIPGPWVGENLLKIYVDRQVATRLGAVPDYFLSRDDFKALIDLGPSTRDYGSIRALFYLGNPDVNSLVPSDFASSMGHGSWLMAISEYLIPKGRFTRKLLHDLYGHRHPPAIPRQEDLNKNVKELSDWWELDSKGGARRQVMLPRDFPYDKMYFHEITDARSGNTSVDTFSVYKEAHLSPLRETVTLKLWHQEITQSQRQEELAFYRSIDKAIFARGRGWVAQAFIPAVEHILLDIGGDRDYELTGLILPAVGLSLKEAMILNDEKSLLQIIEIFKQIASDITWAHKRNIVFSTYKAFNVETALKPANIRINGRGKAVCTSFIHAQSGNSLLHTQGKNWDEEKQADGLSFGRLMIECLLRQEQEDYQAALRAAEEQQKQDLLGSFQSWLKNRLLSHAIELMKGDTSIASIKSQINELSNLIVKPDGGAQSVPSSAAAQNPMPVDREYATCNTCKKLFSSHIPDKNATYFVPLSALGPVGPGARCRGCVEKQSGATLGDMFRDDVSLRETLGDGCRQYDQSQALVHRVTRFFRSFQLGK
ncbi:hypothetical protein M3P05_08265 [Sansalvadorimonas sp. 2012CJ34-2]|uniref:Uncharacterized protein n=1 Tax=Parendozoicomonas callyspongiae TaxID=2942213 RepID=A0ABT0PEX5_9GAMM|nr:hypothetical protein [Sansalvadorimonas sp. 2012CJ34-2]MCL6269930.1 hypothetical protein [Sansalvadorimonas sp. 2012CJ34-2]